MEAVGALPWMVLLGLGALHGINPAMGWLFAVGLGLQERDRRVVWRALGPLALGHALAIGTAVGAVAVIGRWVPLGTLKWIVALVLVGFGVAHLARHWHPRAGGMRVGARKLTVWSFLVASAHGAGLMVLPFLLDATGAAPESAMSAAAGHAHGTAQPLLAGLPQDQLGGIAATLVHTAGYLLVAGLLAVLVYEKLGLRLLRSAWINLDLLWAGALIATAVITPFI